MKSRDRSSSTRMKARLFAFFVGMLAALSAPPGGAAVDVSQSPLYIGSTVPGNLALVPSVEFPTLISVANFGDYDSSKTYTGYFDPDKCYDYIYDVSEPKRHFEPKSAASSHKCNNRWSGNYMNWATTQTIDPFRSALTGGYRVKDTATETWVEKAIADRDGDEGANANFPRRTVNGGGAVKDATPATWSSFRTRIDGLGNKMRFISGDYAGQLAKNDPGNDQPVAYNPAIHPLDGSSFPVLLTPPGLINKKRDSVVYEVSVRVAVCVSGQLEANCKQYGSNYKPEGLLQQYSDRLLYSIFGYVNNGGNNEPDGGVMRARQKFIGPTTRYPAEDEAVNAAREWDPATGVLIRNPNPTDANATGGGVADSGVINYLNKFGQMNTGRVAKSYDNVSELYYTATRYFKNLGNVPSYSTLAADAISRYRDADGFPVITNWDDPIRYQCQANVILGIGDTNTWRDKNVPGDTNGDGEPAKAAEITADDSVDAVKALKQIFRMEGYTDANADTASKSSSYNGRQNSAYIAALAYDAHTRDIRPDNKPNAMDGKQTISTYWVDVVENRDYKKGSNQYWLAAKYGGFTVPEGYNPYPATPAPLADSTWWTGEYVNNDTGYKRPDKFYTAAEAGKMVESLRKAFENIIDEIVGSGASFAANTTSLEAGAQSFQARFYAGSWRGELSAYAIDPVSGALSASPLWNAADKFPSDWTTRKLYTYNGSAYRALNWGNLSAAGQSALGSQDVLDYLRGDRSKEGTGSFRTRKGTLGDIVNSEPVYVGSPNPKLYQGQTFTGASAYPAYVTSKASRTPVVYVGANDGFLHGFNAGSDASDAGKETYGYMPNAVVTGVLKSYTQKDYAHQYMVDGEMTVADVYIGSAWKTVLVGTLGRGGRGVFALDVTDPADVKFLWEKNATDIPALGNNLGKPLIGQVADGQWRVLIGNGPNSTAGNAQLISINIANGNVATIDTTVGGNNALTGARLWDSDGDGFIDAAYAGDLKGNMWRFSDLGGTPSVAKLYTATGPSGAQPITAAPLLARNPKTGDTWVFFGTGRYLSTGDVSNLDVQSWYGVIDKGTTITGARGTVFSKVDILAESGSARAISLKTSAGTSGWYMDLVSPGDVKRGERMVVPNLFQGKALVGTTRIPNASNPCAPSGTGYVMAIDPFTGGRLPSSFFDINGNGTVGDTGDMINVGGQPVPSSGLLLNSGPNRPIFVGGIMQMTLDNGTSKIVKTHSGGNAVKRVTWREVVGGG